MRGTWLRCLSLVCALAWAGACKEEHGLEVDAGRDLDAGFDASVDGGHHFVPFDAAVPERDFDRSGIWRELGAFDELPVDVTTPRDGAPTLLYLTGEGAFRLHAEPGDPTWLGPLTAGASFGGTAASPDRDALLISGERALLVEVAAGEVVDLGAGAKPFGWLPDSSHVVFARDRGVWIADRTGALLRIADELPGQLPEDVYPSPDSRFVALYQGNEFASEPCGTLRLARADRDDSIDVTGRDDPDGCAALRTIKWSADSRFIAFARGRDSHGRWSELVTFDTESGQRALAMPRSTRELDEYAYDWAPSDARLAYLEQDGDDTSLRLFDPRSGTQLELAAMPGKGAIDTRYASGFSWDPRSSFIALCTDQALWQVDLGEPSAPEPSARMLQRINGCAPSLSPGGNWLATPIADHSGLRVVATRGDLELEIHGADLPPGRTPDTQWPDGSHFAFARGGGFRPNLFAIEPGDGDPVDLGPVAADDDDSWERLYWPWPDLGLSQERSAGRGILHMADLAAGESTRVDDLALLGTEFAGPRMQRAFCASRLLGGMITNEDDERFTIVPGSGMELLLLFWQEEPGAPWQQRTLAEAPNPAHFDCFIP